MTRDITMKHTLLDYYLSFVLLPHFLNKQMQFNFIIQFI